MLKKVLLVTPGRYEKDDLTCKGIEDVRWLGRQITVEGLRPKIVFFTSEKHCMCSALIFVGAVESVSHVASLGSTFEIPYHELSSDIDIDLKGSKTKRIWTSRKINLQNKKHTDFWKQFRDALRTERNARTYLGKACPIPDDVEEVAIVSVPGFGGVFPKQDDKEICGYTCWVTPVVYTLDIPTQTLSLSCNPRERFGTI